MSYGDKQFLAGFIIGLIMGFIMGIRPNGIRPLKRVKKNSDADNEVQP